MKVMIDTNIIISALLSPNGQAAKAFQKALRPPFTPLVCQYIIDEVQQKFAEKLAAYAFKLHGFDAVLPLFRLVPTPPSHPGEDLPIRDIKDMPILRAAQAAQADFLLTGDKDFLEAAIDSPQMINAAQFLKL